jgi:diguanylate cyclase (GGDEF)-like protein
MSIETGIKVSGGKVWRNHPVIDSLISEAKKACQRNPEEVKQLAEEIEFFSQKDNYSHGVGMAQIFQAFSLQVQGNLTEMFQKLEEVVKFSQETGDLWLEGEALAPMGVFYQQVGNYEASFECKLRAISLARKTGDTTTLTLTLNNIGIDYGRIGDPTLGCEYHLEALEIARKAHNVFGEAFSLYNLAIAYANTGDAENCLSYQEEALVLARQCGHRSLEAGVLREIAARYLQQGHHLEAVEFAQQSYEIAHRFGNAMIAGRALLLVGEIHQKQGKYAEAQAIFDKTLCDAKEAKFIRGEIIAYCHLGSNYTQQKQFNEAHQCLESALEILEQLQLPVELMEVYQALYQLAEAEGDFVTALAHYKQYDEYKSEVQGQKAHQRHSAISIKLKVEQAEREAKAEREKSEQLHQAYGEKTSLLEQLQAQQKELEWLATRDALTGLYNRRFFEQQMNCVYSDAVANKTPLTVAIVDIDNFKKINDYYGHAIGDTVLQGVAQLFSENLPEGGTVARYGGEEFAILLAHTDAQGAKFVLNSLVRQVATLNWEQVSSDFRVTISVGFCDDMQVPHVEQMMLHADKALYHAKSSGKNQALGSTVLQRAVAR